jgi:hypothetical protein
MFTIVSMLALIAFVAWAEAEVDLFLLQQKAGYVRTDATSTSNDSSQAEELLPPDDTQEVFHPALLNSRIRNASKKSSSCEDGRILLHGIAPAYHGTTALEGVMMSSSKVSTMCAQNVPNCELGGFLATASGDIHQSHAAQWNFAEAWKALEGNWDSNRPIMFDKTPTVLHDVQLVHQGFQKIAGPGVSQAYIVMYRPSCLWRLSHHAQREADRGMQVLASSEYSELLLTVKAHKYFRSVGAPVLVLNLADLMWDTKASTSRIENWMPCLGKLDGCYMPKEGKDVHDVWKVEGSVCSYGKSVKPNKFGYDVKSKSCTHDPLFKHLDQKDQSEVKQAEAYLKKLAQ